MGGSIWNTTSTASEPLTEETFRKGMEALRDAKPRPVLHGATVSALKRAKETGEPFVCWGCGGLHYHPDRPAPSTSKDCSAHHDSFDKRNGKELHLPAPQEVREFAEEFGLEDLL